jgi:hypothetical protein
VVRIDCRGSEGQGMAIWIDGQGVTGNNAYVVDEDAIGGMQVFKKVLLALAQEAAMMG